MRFASFFLLLTLFVLPSFSATANAEDWPSWRGPRGDGSSIEKNVPTHWDGTTGENITWKVELPGWGHSSPIVSNGRVFIVACDEETEDRVLLSLDRKTGKTLWQKTIFQAPLERKHNLNSFASGTPATDGKTVYVTFLQPDISDLRKATPGNVIVAAYDFEGNRQWRVDVGRFSSKHGFCTSPVIYKDKLIINGDHDGSSYIAALDRNTGKTVWKVDRANKTRSYVTPIIREIDGRTQMILSGSLAVTSYDPNDGSIHWTMQGPTEQFVASLVYNNKYLYLTAGFPEHHILCIDPTGSGDVTDTHIRWRTKKGASYVPSPAVIGSDYFFVVSDAGIASCFDAESGEPHWVKRMGPHYSASMITAGGLAYFLSDPGVMTVVKPGADYNVVSENPLGENCYASPAVSDGQIFLRGEKHLFCIGK
ncbi:MAG: serine/threonine protein kinase [Blastopirellula sp.]|nr:MAG: serine/threonine protein kinase [Blastopirellula sp.]